jgi:hypothetical protein
VEQYHPDAIFIKPIDLDALLVWVRDACHQSPHAPPLTGIDGASARASAEF